MPKDKYYDEFVEVQIPRKIAIKLKHILAQNPDADVEDVVRCKDCKYNDCCWQKMDCGFQYNEVVFCSYGVRKDDSK